MTTHYQLMPKPRLVDVIQQTQRLLDAERARSSYWRGYVHRLTTLDTKGWVGYAATVEEARAVMARIGPDPDADNHRDTLERELEAFSPTMRRGPARKPGPRCHRKNCDQRLNEFGLCGRCQSPQTRRARAEAAA